VPAFTLVLSLTPFSGARFTRKSPYSTIAAESWLRIDPEVSPEIRI